MEKILILPIVTLLIVVLLSIFLIFPETISIITGQAVSNEKYFLEGKVRITTPVEIYDSCNLNIIIENEVTKEKITETISANEFKEKSTLEKEGDFFIYTSELNDLTKKQLEKAAYFITIEVFCENNLISQTQEYFRI